MAQRSFPLPGIALKRVIYRACIAAFFLLGLTDVTNAQARQNFQPTGTFNEQELNLNDAWENVTVNINAPLSINKKHGTFLVLFALPNGNTIEWTKGKKTGPGDDWHFDIQHIAAQTRYVRNVDPQHNYIIAYLANTQKSWPAWKKATPHSIQLIENIVDSLSNLFADLHPAIVLNGHSGGGSFIFGYLDAVPAIPSKVQRIAFLDSDYGYTDSLHTKKISDWIHDDSRNKLLVLAYNDSLVIFNGKPLVSPSGGTWYRSRLMQRQLAKQFRFKSFTDTAFIIHQALDQRILFILKENPTGQIYHTTQVERNGFILSLLSGTALNKRLAFQYFGGRAYSDYIGN